MTYLRQSISKKRVVNGYIFQGPEGVGKRLTASVFARALNCRIESGEGCGLCEDCRGIENGSHPDVHTVAPSSKSRWIVINQIRQMQRMVYLSGQRDNWKVFVIKDADRMYVNAQNAFLKTLEEPPEKTVFILISDQPDRLLPTILSRCQRVLFSSWPSEMMEPFLMEKLGLNKSDSYLLHCISGGRPGRAMRLSREGILETRSSLIEPLLKGRFSSGGEVIAQVKVWLDYLAERSKVLREKLEKQRTESRDSLEGHQRKEWEERDEARVAAEERAELEMIFELIFSWIRDLFVCREAGQDAHLINRDKADRIATVCRDRTAAQLRLMMEWVEKSRQSAVKAAARSTRQLIFENMFIQLGYWQPGGK